MKYIAVVFMMVLMVSCSSIENLRDDIKEELKEKIKDKADEVLGTD